ncbi:N-acetylmuramic acid 6-phosphate etherase [Ruegeria sp.]|uniref:N-acetylmuramic acid 6-phosphate etherase n=1 Tax=Ruegeria sp. TaxID=1879320 RepID=UPI00230D597E|nr:N-acetylmuramic acid 6-phosphate etherase [Ruegeria sp.]MDA7965930.1 N-acetylmuramic acid 6-phosphate etherase [Ruegeria sp.]
MITPVTEQLHQDAIGLDARPLADVAALLAQSQAQAATAPAQSIDPICAGARAMAATIRSGGILRYLAAGSSGLMAASDALELGGTFSIPAEQIRIHMAGGLPTGSVMPGDVEDASDSLSRELADLSPQDTVIAVSASGTTPYTVAAAEMARNTGATVIGIANNAGSKLLQLADHPVLLPTPPELISGSTRMGAGTAQKIALNMLSTLMATELGHIQDGMMINLRADNDKLRARAKGIVCQLTGVSPDRAEAALAEAKGALKCAALLAAGAPSPAAAQALLQDTNDHLRPALAQLKQNNETINLGETK